MKERPDLETVSDTDIFDTLGVFLHSPKRFSIPFCRVEMKAYWIIQG